MERSIIKKIGDSFAEVTSIEGVKDLTEMRGHVSEACSGRFIFEVQICHERNLT